VLFSFVGTIRQVGDVESDMVRRQILHQHIACKTDKGSQHMLSNRKMSFARGKFTSFKDPSFMVTSGRHFSTNVLFLNRIRLENSRGLRATKRKNVDLPVEVQYHS
jgi:hypothetical protein